MAAARTRSSYDVPPAKPRSDAYTGLLILSLLAQLAGAVFLFLDYKEYPDNKPTPPKVAAQAPAPVGAPVGTPAPAPAPAPQPGAPGAAMGGMGGMAGGGMAGGRQPGAEAPPKKP